MDSRQLPYLGTIRYTYAGMGLAVGARNSGTWSSGSPVFQLCPWTACNPAKGCTEGTRQSEEVGGLELKSQRRPAFHGGKDLAFRIDLADSLPFQLHFLFSFYLRSVFPINSKWEPKARSQWCLRNAKEQMDPEKQMPARDPTAKTDTVSNAPAAMRLARRVRGSPHWHHLPSPREDGTN